MPSPISAASRDARKVVADFGGLCSTREKSSPISAASARRPKSRRRFRRPLPDRARKVVADFGGPHFRRAKAKAFRRFRRRYDDPLRNVAVVASSRAKHQRVKSSGYGTPPDADMEPVAGRKPSFWALRPFISLAAHRGSSRRASGSTRRTVGTIASLNTKRSPWRPSPGPTSPAPTQA